MMVEVIKHGDRAIVVCDFCGATLRYTKDDVKEEEMYYSQRDSYLIKYIKCPDCNSKVYIKK